MTIAARPDGRPVGLRPYGIVAIPAHNEAERIAGCLAALATQRGWDGAPLPADSFEVIVFANNCTDATVEVSRAVAADSPYPITIVAETLSPRRSNAGWARKRAMDLAAARLLELGQIDGLLLTTDADSRVSTTWIDATLRAVSDGADGVAGYIDADPAEWVGLGGAFMRRGRLEDRYASALAAIAALCDPRPHDPWPNHRVSSGASLAVTLQAYRAIGGLPARAVGEDVALTVALDDAGFKVRHSLGVVVTTSCRLVGRVKGGAAETMRLRHQAIDTPCDDDFEPALHWVRRSLVKSRLRAGDGRWRGEGGWSARLKLPPARAELLAALRRTNGFETFWRAVSAASPILRQRTILRPSDLPREIRRAEMCLRALRRSRDREARQPIDIVNHLMEGSPVGHRLDDEVISLIAGHRIIGRVPPMAQDDLIPTGQ